MQSIEKYIYNGKYINYNRFESDSEANQKLTLKLLFLDIVINSKDRIFSLPRFFVVVVAAYMIQ